MLRLLLTACLVLPALGHAAGLGRLTVSSALGEPLRAEVEVTSIAPSEEESLAARLASPDAYRQAGIDYSSMLMSIRVALEKRDGKPVVRLTSSRPIYEPFMSVLLELQWSQGRLVREYTFLLDPPGYRDKGAAAAPPTPAEAPTVARASPAPVSPEARPLAPQAAPTGRNYEIKRGDTLGKIARENKPEGVTFQQMLVALYRANQGAFINHNINLIRTGRILQIPDKEAASAIPAGEARQVVHKHMADFAEYRSKLGAAVTAAPASAAPSQREATGRIAAKPEAPAPGGPKDQLKLSRADAKSSSAAQAAREDDRTSSDRALKEAQSRVTDLEKNVGDLQKLLDIKNRQLAQLEQKAGAAPAAAAAKDAPKPAEPPKPAAEAPKPAAEAPKPAAEAPKPAAEAPKPVPVSPKPAPVAAKPKPAPAPEPSLIDEFLGNPVALGGLGGVVLLLIGYGVYAWRRKKASQSRFQDGMIGAAEPVLATEPKPNAQAAATAAAVSAAVAATQAGASAQDVDDVDPIAEADVYLAYGRDAQAEEILRESLARHPERVAVHMKLLEIFAQRHDVKGFAGTARTVKDLTQGAGPEWDKTRALGHSIDPDNSLYGGAAAVTTVETAAPAAAPTPSVDIDLGGNTDPGAGRAATLDFDIGAATTPGGEGQPFKPGDTIILQPGDAGTTASAPQPAPADKLDFDLGDLGTPAAASAQPAPARAAPVAAASLDFDLDLDDLGTPKSGQAAQAPVDLSAISLDLGTPATAGKTSSSDPRWQEVATKLDLAKAYQGMGDKDGARQLLNEVMSQGDAAQQSEAKQLLSTLG